MFTLTPTAATALDELRRQQQLPASYGIRVSARPTPDGQVGVQLGFAEGPDPTDAVQEQHGTMVFVAQEVAEPLSEVALDANLSASSNGDSPPELLLRPQQPGDA
jgi:Fe-S cluster assembly iron-binding protein IscA